MEQDRYEKFIQFLLALCQGERLSADDLSQRFDISRRTAYRFLNLLPALGFEVEKRGARFGVSTDSPFFRKINDRIHFSEAEALLINQVLCSVTTSNPQVRALRDKLARLYDPEVLTRHAFSDRQAANLSALFTAMKEGRIAVLHGYTSAHSDSVTDRIVEPYHFLNENTEVRCFELRSKQNKTFKLSRIESVELLDLKWMNREAHRPVTTDLFHFSGEAQHHVTLRLGRLSTSLLLEEFADADRFLTAEPDGRHRLELDVCSFKGIARFVVGLLDDIEILGSPEFAEHMRSLVAALTTRIDEAVK